MHQSALKYYHLITFCLLASCIDRIDFPTNYQASQLVVYGQVNNLEDEQVVYISRTSDGRDLFTITPEGIEVFNDLPAPVNNASVFLVNENGLRYPYFLSTEGKYVLSENIPKEDRENLSYHLEIEVDGKIIQSVPEKMPPSIGQDSSFFTFGRGLFGNNPSVPLLSIKSKTFIPSDASSLYLRWDLQSVYRWERTQVPNPFNVPTPPCYVIEPVDGRKIVTLEGSRFAGEAVEQTLGIRRIDRAFASIHYIIVRQMSITADAFRFWNQMKLLSETSGSLFDVPPAPLRGNLFNPDDAEEIVLGIFELARAQETNFFTVRAIFPFVISSPCTYEEGRNMASYPPECFSCEALPGATLNVPRIFQR